MKNLIIIVSYWISFIPVGFCQHSFTYAPDNSVLSIILDKVKLDSTRSEFVIDLKNRWKYRKIRHVEIDIRGQLLTPSPIQQVDSVEVIFKVYGKIAPIKIDSKENFIITFRRTKRQMKCTPEIRISTKLLPEWELYIDTIDMAAISG